jgi:hypothetical protein
MRIDNSDARALKTALEGACKSTQGLKTSAVRLNALMDVILLLAEGENYQAIKDIAPKLGEALKEHQEAMGTVDKAVSPLPTALDGMLKKDPEPVKTPTKPAG